MNWKQAIVLASTLISAGVGAWIHAGEPGLSGAFTPVLTGFLGALALFMQPPSVGGGAP